MMLATQILPLILGSSLVASTSVLSRRVVNAAVDISHLKNIVPTNKQIHELGSPIEHHDDAHHHAAIKRLQVKQDALQPHLDAYRAKQQAVLDRELPKLKAEGVKPGHEHMGRLVKALGPQLMSEREALIRAHEDKILKDWFHVKYQLPDTPGFQKVQSDLLDKYLPNDDELNADLFSPGNSVSGRRDDARKHGYWKGTPWEHEPRPLYYK